MALQDGKLAVSPWMQKVLRVDGGSIETEPYQAEVSVGDYLNSLRPLSMRELAGQTVGGLAAGAVSAVSKPLEAIGVAGSHIAQGILDATGSDRQVRPADQTLLSRTGQFLDEGAEGVRRKLGADRPYAETVGSFVADEVAPAIGAVAPVLATGGAAVPLLAVQATAQQAIAGYADAKQKGADDATAWKAYLWNLPIGAAFMLGPGRQVAALSKAMAAVEKQTGRSLSRWALGTAIGSGEMAAASALGDKVGQELGYGEGVELEKALKGAAVGGALAGFFGAIVEATRAKAPTTARAKPLEPEAATAVPEAAKAGETPAKAEEPRSPAEPAPAAPDPKREAAIEQAVQKVAKSIGAEVVTRADPGTPEHVFFEEWMRQHGKEPVGIEPGAGTPRPFDAALEGDVVVYNVRTDPKLLRESIVYHEGVHALDGAAQKRLADAIERVDPEGARAAREDVAARYGADAEREGHVPTYAETVAPWIRAAEQRPDKLAALISHEPGTFLRLVDALKRVAQKLGIKVRTSFETKFADFARDPEPGRLGPEKTAELARAFYEEFEALRGTEPTFAGVEVKPPAAPEAPRAAAPAPAEPPAPAPAPTTETTLTTEAPKSALPPKPPKAKAAPKPKPPPKPKSDTPIEKSTPLHGREGELVLPSGKPVPVRYRVVDARELVPSHDPTQGYVRNKGGDLNERDYGHPVEGRAYRETVEKIAGNPRPGLVLTDTPSASDGPPIVGPGMRVLGGNARSMGLQLAYAKGGEPAARMREAVRESAERFGVDPARVREIERPVLVRELSAEHAGEPGEMSRVLNQPLTTAKTANTEAVSRGSKIDPDTAVEVSETIGDGTLREAMGDAASTGRLMRALVKSGAFGDADLTALLDNRGLLTQTGRDIVEQTLLGSVVTNLGTLSELPPSTRATVLKALPFLLRARTSLDDFGPAFLNALEGVIEVRQTGRSLKEARAQALMPGLEAGWKTDPLALRLAERLLDDTPTEFARRMGVLAEALRTIDEGQGDLFAPGGKLTHEQALEEAFVTQAKREEGSAGRRSATEPDSAQQTGGSNPLFALARAPRPVAPPKHTAVDTANELIVESFARAHAVESTLANPNRLHPTVRRAEELMHGKNAAHDEWVRQHFVERITEEMRQGGIHPTEDKPGLPSASSVLIAQHAPRRNDTMRRRHPRKFGLQANPGSGMTDLESAAILRDARRSGQWKHYEALIGANRALNQRYLDLSVQAGLISAEHRATLLREFGRDYVPLKTHYEGAIEYLGGHSLGVTGTEFKRAEGRITEADNPIVFQIQDKLRLARRAEKNRVDLALREAVIRNPNFALWEYRQSRSSIDTAAWEEGRVLTFKFGGQDRFVVFHDKPLANAFKHLDTVLAGSAVRVIDTINRWLRGTIIRYNPVWAAVNPIRDVLTAVPKAAVKYGPAFAFDVARNQVAAGVGAFRAMRDPNAVGFWADRYREAAKSGGLVSWADILSWGQRLEQLERDVTRGGTAQTIYEAGRFLSALTSASEMGTRLSAYDAARKRGMSASDAAWIMRNITVDFARHGSASGLYGRAYLFSGANIQGARSSLEWLRSHPARAAGIVGTMIGMGYTLALTSRALADENESGLNEFDARRDGELSAKLGIMVGKTYIGLPMPWFFGQFFNLGRRLEQLHHGRMTLDTLSTAAAIDAVQSFSPTQGANLVQAATPTFLRPVTELAQNQDFAGRLIYSTPFPTDPTPPPQSERFLPDVNPALREGARALNRATGGDAINPGKVDINPEWVEHTIKFALGGIGTQGGHALDVAQKWISGEDWSVTELPLVHSFASNSSPGLHKALFRDSVRDIEYAHETAAAARERGEPVPESVRQLDSLHARARIAENTAKRFTKAGNTEEALKVMQEFNRYFESERK